MGYVAYENDIKISFINAFKAHFSFETDTPDEQFHELEIYLNKLKGDNNLLVIDDIKTQEEFNIIKALQINVKLLITSRVEFEDIDSYYIDTLSSKKAKELFLYNYPTSENIDKILEYLGYHTLFITLTAQVLKKSIILDIKTLEIKFKNKEFPKITKKGIQKKEFNEFLTKLFKIDELSESKVLILKKISLFPSIDIEFNDLIDFLCIEHIDRFEDDILELAQTGWLINNGNDFKLHQIIKEFIVFNHPILYDECEDIVNKLYEKIYKNSHDNPIEKFQYIPFVVSIINTLEVKNKILADLINSLSIRYQDMGEYPKALEYQKKVIEIFEETLGEKHPDTATSYNNISEIYRNMGEYPKALEYQKKDLEISKETLGEKHPDTATSYNNISLIYQAMGEYPKALEYQKKVIEIVEEILGEKHPNTAASYNNISSIYQDMGEYPKALEYQKRAIEIKKEILGEKHPNTAISYANISQLYFINKEKAKAKEFIDKGIEIMEELFPKGHPNLDVMLETKEYFNNNS